MTNSFNSVYDIFDAMDECASDTKFTESLGFDAKVCEVLPCSLQEDTGVYACLPNDVNFLIAETSDLYSPHLQGEGEITVCRIETPNGEMFDQEEVEVKQLGKFDDFAEAYATFIAAVRAELSK